MEVRVPSSPKYGQRVVARHAFVLRRGSARMSVAAGQSLDDLSGRELESLLRLRAVEVTLFRPALVGKPVN